MESLFTPFGRNHLRLRPQKECFTLKPDGNRQLSHPRLGHRFPPGFFYDLLFCRGQRDRSLGWPSLKVWLVFLKSFLLTPMTSELIPYVFLMSRPKCSPFWQVTRCIMDLNVILSHYLRLKSIFLSIIWYSKLSFWALLAPKFLFMYLKLCT